MVDDSDDDETEQKAPAPMSFSSFFDKFMESRSDSEKDNHAMIKGIMKDLEKRETTKRIVIIKRKKEVK